MAAKTMPSPAGAYQIFVEANHLAGVEE